MEFLSQLDAAGSARVFPLVLLAFLLPHRLLAQCPSEQPRPASVQQLFADRKWSDVVAWAEAQHPRTASVYFDDGMALAHLQRWAEARAALAAGRRDCPADKRFPIELAGVAFEMHQYPEAAMWARSGLRLDPNDRYALDLAGTVYFLMGNLDAALKYWNRIQKPFIADLQFDSQLRVHRLLLDRSFAFSPSAVLKEAELQETDARLKGLGIFPMYKINLVSRSGGTFDAQFHAMERNGFGPSRVQALVSTFSGAPYETIYPSYFNLGRSAANVESLLRWDSQKRRAQLSISAPIQGLPRWRWRIAGDGRNENWAIRRSFAGTAPVLGSLNLKRETVEGRVSFLQSGRIEWSTGGEISHRNFRNVEFGTALTSSLVSPGTAFKQFDRLAIKLVDIPERRFTVGANGSSEFARIWSSPSHVFEKLQASTLARWFPQAAGDKYEADEKVSAGRTFGQPPFDELFMLGVERDNDLWLRGLIGTRGGRKGSSPLGTNYVLSNSDFSVRVLNGGLFSIKAGPLFDFGRAGAPASGLSSGAWLFSPGAQAKLTAFGTSVVLSYGRNVSFGQNAFFATVTK